MVPEEEHFEVCVLCGGNAERASAGTSDDLGTCPNCGVRVIVRSDETVIEVDGRDHTEVREVADHLTKRANERQKEADAERAARQLAKKGPWLSGLFYLLAAAVVAGIVLGAAAIVPIWAVPIILVAAILLLSVVGALQLRNDDKLSERGFLSLMKLALSQSGKLAGRSSAST
jgi:Flp pilus assembly protein TadB